MAKNSLDETRALKVLLAQVRGFCESIQDILHNKDTAEIGRYTSFRDMAHTYNDLAETARVLLRVPSMFYTFNVDEMPSWGDSVWPVQKKILEQVWVSAKLLYSSLEGSIDFVDDEFDNLENFIQSRLRAVIFEKPQREVEVQNALAVLSAIGRRTCGEFRADQYALLGSDFVHWLYWSAEYHQHSLYKYSHSHF